MTQRYTIEMHGVLRTDSPFANSPKDHVNKDKVALLPRMQINVGGALLHTPVIQASTLRGKIRRAAAEVLLERFEAAGVRPTFNDWLLWSLGGVKGSEKEGFDAVKRTEIIERSALLAMFGAGSGPVDGMVGGRFFIAPGIPDIEIKPDIVASARGAENRNPRLVEFLDPNEIEKVQIYTDANRDRSILTREIANVSRAIKASERNLREGKESRLNAAEIADEKLRLASMEQQHSEISAVAAEAGSDNAMGRPLPGYEVLPQGLEMPHFMIMKSATLGQIGFVAAALRMFTQEPFIGAHVSSGCGLVSGRYDVTVREGRSYDRRHDGTLAFSLKDGLVTRGLIDTALAEWDNAPFDPSAYRS